MKTFYCYAYSNQSLPQHCKRRKKKIKNLYMLQQPTLLDKMKLLSYLVLKKCWQSVYTYSSFLSFFCQSHFQTKIDRFIHDWLYDKLASIYQLKGFCWCLNSTIFFYNSRWTNKKAISDHSLFQQSYSDWYLSILNILISEVTDIFQFQIPIFWFQMSMNSDTCWCGLNFFLSF